MGTITPDEAARRSLDIISDAASAENVLALTQVIDAFVAEKVSEGVGFSNSDIIMVCVTILASVIDRAGKDHGKLYAEVMAAGIHLLIDVGAGRAE